MILQARMLKVYTKMLNAHLEEESSVDYFYAYEFKNGLIMVVGETTNNWFFEDRNSIEACGTEVVDGIEVIEDVFITLSSEELLESALGSKAEFGEDSVPEKYKELIKEQNNEA